MCGWERLFECSIHERGLPTSRLLQVDVVNAKFTEARDEIEVWRST